MLSDGSSNTYCTSNEHTLYPSFKPDDLPIKWLFTLCIWHMRVLVSVCAYTQQLMCICLPQTQTHTHKRIYFCSYFDFMIFAEFISIANRLHMFDVAVFDGQHPESVLRFSIEFSSIPARQHPAHRHARNTRANMRHIFEQCYSGSMFSRTHGR